MKKRKQQKSQIPIYLLLLGGLFLIFTAVLLSTQNAPASETPVVEHEEGYPEIQRVTLTEAKAALDNGTAIIVDVRAAEAYDASHVTGSINLPLAEIESRLAELHREQWIITYCT